MIDATGFDVVDRDGNLLQHYECRPAPDDSIMDAIRDARLLSEWHGIATRIVRCPDGALISTISIIDRKLADRLAGYPQTKPWTEHAAASVEVNHASVVEEVNHASDNN